MIRIEVWGSGFRALAFRVLGVGLSGLRIRVKGLESRAESLFRVYEAYLAEPLTKGRTMALHPQRELEDQYSKFLVT